METVPRSEWTDDEREFDRLVDLMDSKSQTDRIEGRTEWWKFSKRFTTEQLDAMWLRINGTKRSTARRTR